MIIRVLISQSNFCYPKLGSNLFFETEYGSVIYFRSRATKASLKLVHIKNFMYLSYGIAYVESGNQSYHLKLSEIRNYDSTLNLDFSLGINFFDLDSYYFSGIELFNISTHLRTFSDDEPYRNIFSNGTRLLNLFFGFRI